MDKQLRNALQGLAAEDVEKRRRAMEPFVRATFHGFMRCLYRYLGNEGGGEDVLEEGHGEIRETPQKIIGGTADKGLSRTV